MRRITYENSRGERIVFYLSPLVITSLTGIGEVDSEIQNLSAPYQDGDSYIHTVLEPRYIDAEITITKTNLKEIKNQRKRILRVCNPKLGLGKLTLELDGDIKEIGALLDGVPTFPEKAQEVWQKCSVSFKCPNPYWRDPEESTRPLKAFEGTFTFPFTFQVQFGVESDTTILNNGGDTTTPITVEIKGPIRRPLIENLTTGKFMQVNAIVEPNQTLVIDTNPLNKRVVLRQGNEERTVMGWFDQEGDFLQLVEGDNEIRYRADAGIAEASAIVKWNNRYVGV